MIHLFAEDDDDFEELCQGFLLKNTASNMWKSMQLFGRWKVELKLHFVNDKRPDGLLPTDDDKILSTLV